MKHLQSKKIFESANEVDETIKDICLELKDEGFTIKMDEYGFISGTSIICKRIRIMRLNGSSGELLHMLFRYSEVEEVVNRIEEYLGKRFISNSPTGHNSLNSLDRTSEVTIYYKNIV